MVGSSSLQRLMKRNPDGTWAALQTVPEPPGSAKTLRSRKQGKTVLVPKRKSLQGTGGG